MPEASQTIELSLVELGNAVLKRYCTVEYDGDSTTIAIDFFTDNNVPVELSSCWLTFEDLMAIQTATVTVLGKANGLI